MQAWFRAAGGSKQCSLCRRDCVPEWCTEAGNTPTTEASPPNQSLQPTASRARSFVLTQSLSCACGAELNRWAGRPTTWRPERSIGQRGACLGARSIRTRGACFGCWHACLGGRSIRTQGRMPRVLRCMPGVLVRLPRRASSDPRSMPRALARMPGVLVRLPRRSAISRTLRMPGVPTRMPQRSVNSARGACLGCWHACLGAGRGDARWPPAPPNTPFQLTASRARSCVF